MPNTPLAPAIDRKTSTSLDLYAGFNPYKNVCSNTLGRFTCVLVVDDNGVPGENETTTFETNVLIIEPLKFFYGTIEYLTPFKKYSCTAQIQNDAGWSENSGAAVYQTNEDCK